MQKACVRQHFDRLAPKLWRWKRKNWLYHANIEQELRSLVEPGQRVVEIGCATGDLLSALEPSYGLGVDISPRMIEIAREKHPDLDFAVGDAENLSIDGDFDVIVMVHLLGHLDDIHQALEGVRRICRPDTRVIIVNYNFLYEVPFRAAERLGLKTPHQLQNWVPLPLLRQTLHLTDFQVLDERFSLLVPKHIPVITPLLNAMARAFSPLHHLCITQIVVAQPTAEPAETADLSCTVLIPTRNEKGNIGPAVQRTPEMGRHTEILFVDGNSTDGTQEEIRRMIDKYEGEKDIKLLHQLPPEEAAADDAVAESQKTGKMLPQGKGHAVRVGFDAAEGDVLMILDADLTVPPEDLPRFFEAITRGKTEFANGSRLVYPMEDEAMRLPNLLGNKFFSVLFSWLLDRYVGDTLCGTKALRKEDYEKIAANRSYFGDFDPFGDFDLLFGAAYAGFDIVDIPVHYQARTAGESKIINTRHAPLLFAMSWVGFVRLVLPRWWNAIKYAFRGPPPPVGVQAPEETTEPGRDDR